MQMPIADFWQPLLRDDAIWAGLTATEAQREEIVRRLSLGEIAIPTGTLPDSPQTVFNNDIAQVFIQRLIGKNEFIVPQRYVHLVDFFLRRGRASVEASGNQQQALAMLNQGKDLLISGGPGTGKSYLIEQFLEKLTTQGGTRPKRIVIAAPTGKAAARFSHQQNTGGILLECSTIHRVLGIGNTQSRPRYHRRNPIACDILIIDEISMVELSLFTALIDALPPHAQLVVAGDLNQLPAVGGLPVDRALALLTEQNLIQHSALTVVHRFSAEKAALYAAIAVQGIAAATDFLQTFTPRELTHFITGYALEHYASAASNALRLRLETELFNDTSCEAAVKEALRYNAQHMILCERREGLGSSLWINRRIRETLTGSRETLTPIVATANNYRLGIFNGDTGVLVTHAQGNFAVFITADGKLRRLPANELSGRDDAWALTIHKSQGSEYQDVYVITDGKNTATDHRLLYTAVTRARNNAVIFRLV